MTEEERRNRNPKPEVVRIDPATLVELFIKDLERHRVYILAQTKYATANYMGTAGDAYWFQAPRVTGLIVLRRRPNDSGTLEDGRGVKVTIYRYDGPDA